MSESNRLVSLVRQGKITDFEYLTYLVFTGDDVGERYLRMQLDSIVMEEPIEPTESLFAWHDGRRSVWRDIKRMIDMVNKELEETQNDRSSRTNF